MAKTKKRHANQRHYTIDEWVEAEVDHHLEGISQDRDLDLDALEEAAWQEVPMKDLDELRDAQSKFTEEAARVVEGWMEKHPDQAASLAESDDVESDDDIAYNTWNLFTGAGVGFWEHMSNEEYESLSKAVRSDKKLEKARSTLEIEIMNVSGAAEDIVAARGKKMKPKQLSQLKNKLLR